MTRTPSHEPVNFTRAGEDTQNINDLRAIEQMRHTATQNFGAREFIKFLIRADSSLDETAKTHVIAESDKYFRALGDLTRSVHER